MNKITMIRIAILIMLTNSNIIFSQLNERNFHKSVGPNSGTLLIGGGGMTDELWKIFRENAGVDSARLVVIPTSWGENSLNYDTTFSKLKNKFIERGFYHVDILHTKDTNVANSENFVKPLKQAHAVWLTGGRQWRSADVYLNTLTHKELNNLLERGGIIGGHSAGASIQGSFLTRGSREEFGSNYIMGGQETGFGFISNIAIDQHHLYRNRQYDMFDLLESKPEILGIGIDENTAVLVKKNMFEVVGESYVTIYDGTFWTPYFDNIDTLKKGEEKFYFLNNGRKYDLQKRQVIVNKYLSHEPIDSLSLLDYVGKYQIGEKRYWFDAYIQNDTLFVQRTIGPNINPAIPIYPKGKDIFFDKNSIWWYRFERDENNEVVRMIRDDNKLIKRHQLKLHRLPSKLAITRIKSHCATRSCAKLKTINQWQWQPDK